MGQHESACCWEQRRTRVTNSEGKLISGNGVDFMRLELNFNQIMDVAIDMFRKIYGNSTMRCDAVTFDPKVMVSSVSCAAISM